MQAENEALQQLVLDVAQNKQEAQRKVAGLKQKYSNLLAKVSTPLFSLTASPAAVASLAAAAATADVAAAAAVTSSAAATASAAAVFQLVAGGTILYPQTAMPGLSGAALRIVIFT